MSKDNSIQIGQYRQLSAFIVMIFAECTKSDPKFKATGYDLTQIAEEIRFKFSHQQIYREIKKISILSKEHVPQEFKPDKALYCLTDNSPEHLDQIADMIDYDPSRTNLKMFLAFNHIKAVTHAYIAMLEHTHKFTIEENRYTDKLLLTNGKSHFTNVIYCHDLQVKELLLSSLKEHLINIVNDQMKYDEAIKYLVSIDNKTEAQSKWKLTE